MGKNTYAPGFRFHPTDMELIMYYLKRKILGKKLSANPIAEVDIYKFAPWDLPDKSCLKTGDLKWHFFCPISKKYGRGDRVNRANEYGYWKTTGKDKPVKYNDEVVGQIKTLVFHQGKAPRGERTDWVMHEYRLEEKKLADRGIVQDSYMLYVIFKKDGRGPKNGAQYGAPFKEEDWIDDDEDEDEETNTVSLCGTSAVAGGSCIPESLCVDSSAVAGGSCIPESLSSGVHTVPLIAHADSSGVHTVPLIGHADTPMVVLTDYVSMQEIFSEEGYQMTANVTNSFIDSPKFSEDDDILSILAAYTAVDNSDNWCL